MTATARARALALAMVPILAAVAHGGVPGSYLTRSVGARPARAAPPSALHAKARTTKRSEPLNPDEYMRYLQSEQDRTELDTSPPTDVDDVPERHASAASSTSPSTASEGSRTLAKSRQSAELIAEESSKGYLDESDEMRWYLVQCTPGFERSIERSFAAKVEYAGLQNDIAEARVPMRRTLVFQKRAGGYVPKEEPLMAGYVMVRMRMRRNLYNFVKDCESVLGFCGYDFGARNNAGGLKAGKGFVKPKPISEAEAARIWAQTAVQPKPPGDAPVIDPAQPAADEPAAAASEADESLDADAADGSDVAGAAVVQLAAPALELNFGEGDRVRVLKGPFKNMEGPVLALRAAGAADDPPDDESGDAGVESSPNAQGGAVEVEVELVLMGQPTRITVDARALASVLE